MPYHSHPPQARAQSQRIAETASCRLAAYVFSLRGFQCHASDFLSLRNCLIGQSLALGSNEQVDSTLEIMNAIGNAIAEPEVEFVNVPLQMMLAYMVIGADDSALENAEITFHGVAVGAHTFDLRRFRILALSVIHRLMPGKRFADWTIEIRAVSHQVSVFRNVLHDDRLEVVKVNIRNMERTGFPLTRYKRKNLVAMTAARDWLSSLRSAEVGFISLNDRAAATEQAAVVVLHRLTNPVRHEPCRFQGNAKSAMQLVRTDSLLARRDQENGLEPQVHLDVAGFENGADLHGERLAAVITLVCAYAGALAAHLAIALSAAAVRAYRAFGPDVRFNEGIRSFFVMKVGF